MIYFVQQKDDKLIKIGTTESLHARMYELQREYGNNLQLLGTCPGSYALESEIHAQFQKDWRFGEWFKPSEELLSYIAANTTLPKRSTNKGTSYTIRRTKERDERMAALVSMYQDLGQELDELAIFDEALKALEKELNTEVEKKS